MKVHRFKNTNPLPGDRRKTPKSARSRERADNDAKFDAVNALSNSIDMLVTRKSKNTGRGTDETETGGDRATETNRIDRAEDVGMGYPAGPGEHFPRAFLGTDLDQDHDSREFKIERIRRNIAEGYYNSPEFIEKLANTLIKKLRLAGEGD